MHACVCACVRACVCVYLTLHVYVITLCNILSKFVCVCVEVLRPSQPNGVMSNAVSLPSHKFTQGLVL